ncbi:unnamed protein product [Penicillium salamii]|nr:unnamed protein product [Penicillium salamii]
MARPHEIVPPGPIFRMAVIENREPDEKTSDVSPSTGACDSGSSGGGGGCFFLSI